MVDAVPVIDISGFEKGDELSKTRVANAVSQALEEIGFFVIQGHGVDPKSVTELREVAWPYFDLPLEEKLKSRKLIKGAFRGYVTAADENLAYMQSGDEEVPHDLKEFFAMGQFDYGADPYYRQQFAEFAFPSNIWPAQPQEFATMAKRYYRELEGLTQRLCRIFEKGLGLADGFFRDKFDHHAATLRLLHYPNQAEDPLPGQLRCGAHTDFDAITLLSVDDAPGGLQVQSRSGEWMDIPAVQNGIVLNTGDLMMTWTNDRWRSGLHRVVNPPRDAKGSMRRLSLAYFVNPNYDALIECLPTCRGPGRPALYKSVMAGQYRVEKIVKATSGAPASATA